MPVEETPETVYGAAAKDFPRLETGLYLADALRRAADTDLGIILVGKASCGTVARIDKGEITGTALNTVGLNTFSGEDPELNKFVVTTMTGDRIIKALQSSLEDDLKSQSMFTCFVTAGLTE